ncbi:MAG: 1,4-dihydroxy-2-naphthoate polyprenyltransferase [Bacteroidales bacterium]|nr:1,4-dihydroxy-2-naphthoate polyprenyltransferase [Bacteroidales bacterium]MCF8337326.1 1,4-dihydroxy-2-naphthoate polyprenyltransferase [Bacteroidales bacterium]
MTSVKTWIGAFRLRTLPLSMASIILGSLLAYYTGGFDWGVFGLALLTTLSLQILSNLANDYGDSKNGIDNTTRVGPQRTVQSGLIPARKMKAMIISVIILSLMSGSALVFIGIEGENFWYVLLFLVLGLVAIVSAIKYTVGKNPYGYRGLGDLFVFVFFGLAGVVGTFYLHTNTLPPDIFLPATSIGLLSVGVLNLNNMRDRVSDKNSGKKTLVVILGSDKAKIYHIVLLAGAILSGLVFSFMHFHTPYQFLFLITLPFLIMNIREVLHNTIPKELDPELRKLAIATLIFSFSFGIGYLM